MTSPSHIWIASEGNDSAHILFTDDLGETWTVQYNDSSKTKFFNYIEMFDSKNGVAMGDAPSDSGSALFLQTSDGGQNWNAMENNLQIFGSGDTWRRLDFVSPDVGFFCEYWGHKPEETQGITKTIDGGNNWEVVKPNVGPLLMKFYDKNIGLARTIKYIEPNSYVFQIQRTLDGGDSWQVFETDSTGWANDFEFIPGDPSKVWFVDGWGNSLFYSNDTGRTWSKQSINNEDIYGRDIVFVDESHGWILGDNGNLFYTNNNGGIITNVERVNTEQIPNAIKLYQNYPNPFNPVTTIKYSIKSKVKSEKSNVKLIVYDVIGNEIATLVNEQKSTGNYEVKFDASNLSSGIYYYQLTTGNFVKTNKMILLK